MIFRHQVCIYHTRQQIHIFRSLKVTKFVEVGKKEELNVDGGNKIPVTLTIRLINNPGFPAWGKR